VSGITLSGVSNASASYTAQVSQAQRPARDDKDPMDPVAKALGVSTDELHAELDEGDKSLNDLATSAGLSHDDLVAAIKAGMPSDATGSGPGSTSATDLTAVAEKIASTKGAPPPPPPGGFNGGPGFGPADGASASAVVGNSAKLGGLSRLYDLDADSADSLSSAQSSGDIVKLLQKNGADLGQLKSVLNSGDLLNTLA
jgi:hypothetical protein